MTRPKINKENAKCCLCGTTETSKWLRYYDKKGNWNGISLLCNICYKKTRYVLPKGYDIEYKKYKQKKYENMVCCLCCGKDTYIYLGVPRWVRFIDENGYWDGKSYMCRYCEGKKKQERLDSQNNIIESISNWRTGELSIFSNSGKGIIGEMIIAKVRKLEIIAIKMDELRNKIDIEGDPELGIIQVKARTLKNGKWNVGTYISEEIFDYVVLVCMDEYWRNVERIYIIPRQELINRTGFAVVKNPSRPTWYSGYKVDEKPYNDAYHSFLEYLKGRKYFGIEDIKKWLSLNE